MPFNSFVVKIPKGFLLNGTKIHHINNLNGYGHIQYLILMLTYIDHSTKDNGCLWGIPNHHLVGHVEINNFTEEQLFNHPTIAYEMEPGDVSFHSLSAPHGSKVNKTNDFRRTFYLHYLNKIVYEECYRDDPNLAG